MERLGHFEPQTSGADQVNIDHATRINGLKRAVVYLTATDVLLKQERDWKSYNETLRNNLFSRFPAALAYPMFLAASYYENRKGRTIWAMTLITRVTGMEAAAKGLNKLSNREH